MPIFRNEEFFGKRTRMSREESKSRRFLVYDYIKAHQGENVTNLDLARAAGYHCDLHENEREYKRGLGFIDNMVRCKYISFTDYPGQEGRLWYVGCKDLDYDETLRTTTIALPATTEELRAQPFEEDALIVKEEPVEAEVVEPKEEIPEEPSEEVFHFDCIVSLQTDADHRVKFNLKDTDLESLLAKIKSAAEVIR